MYKFADGCEGKNLNGDAQCISFLFTMTPLSELTRQRRTQKAGGPATEGNGRAASRTWKGVRGKEKKSKGTYPVGVGFEQTRLCFDAPQICDPHLACAVQRLTYKHRRIHYEGPVTSPQGPRRTVIASLVCVLHSATSGLVAAS